MMPGAAMPASFACRSSSPRIACRLDCTSGRLTVATVGLIIIQSGGLRPSSARVGPREVFESRVLLQEDESHRARGPVALFADDQLGDALGLGWHLTLDRIHL